MKTLIVTIAFLMSSAAFGHECCPTKCEQPKPKIITRTKVVEKVVEKLVPVIVEQERVKVVPQKIKEV